jgi:hypothetical protein
MLKLRLTSRLGGLGFKIKTAHISFSLYASGTLALRPSPAKNMQH